MIRPDQQREERMLKCSIIQRSSLISTRRRRSIKNTAVVVLRRMLLFSMFGSSLMMMSSLVVAFSPSSSSSRRVTTLRRRLPPPVPPLSASASSLAATAADKSQQQKSASVWTMKATTTTSANMMESTLLMAATTTAAKTEMFLPLSSSSFSNHHRHLAFKKQHPFMGNNNNKVNTAVFPTTSAAAPTLLVVKGLTPHSHRRTRGILGFQVDEHHHVENKGHGSTGSSTSTSSNSKSKLQATRRATSTTSFVDSSSSSSSTWNGVEQQHWKLDLSNNGPPVTSVQQENTAANSWLSWIPTRQQIDSLNVLQLKQVLQERGLPHGTGNKDELRNRMHDWMNRQRRIVQQSLALTSHGSSITSSLWQDEYYDEHVEHDDDDEDGNSVTSSSSTSTSIIADTAAGVNSLAEWARTVDLEPLLQRRQEIHREKRLGKKKNYNMASSSSSSSDLIRNQNPTKEYLSSLTKVFDESPPASSSSSSISSSSSTLSSPAQLLMPLNNFQVQQMYAAAKKADLQGNKSLSKQILQQLQQATPQDGRIYRRLARLEKEQGNVSGARAILQQGIRHLQKVSSLSSLSSSSSSKQQQQQQQQQHGPTLAFLWHGLGQLADTKPEAKRCYQKAIACDASLPHPYHALGTLEHTEGRIAPAMKILKQGISYCPTNHRLHHALGDLYRDAKLLDMARKSYNKALVHGPDISHGFAYTALAYIAYEQGSSSSSSSSNNNKNNQEYVDECRIWLKKAIRASQGRQAKAWVALAQMEEAEGNISAARATCIAALAQYERGLVQRSESDYYSNTKKQQGQQQPSKRILPPSVFGRNVTDHDNNDSNNDEVTAIKNSFWKQVPVYRSGDRFYQVYRNWARLEERYGTMESVDEVYQRAIMAFPNEWKFRVDWAMYYQKQMNLPTGRARELFSLACSKAAHRHGDPCRLYAQLEMSLGNYEQARKILFRGSVAMSELAGNGGGGSSSSGSGRQRHCSNSLDGLAELYHTWGVCEWHLDNLPRAQNLFDHALRMTNDDVSSRSRGGITSSGGSTGSDSSKLRSLILYTMARLHHYRGEYLLAQHCIGLALKECTTVPRIWDLWARVANKMDNVELSERLQEQADLARSKLENQKHDHQPPEDMRPLMRRDPWYHKIFEYGFNSKKGSYNDAAAAADDDDDDVYHERVFHHGVRLPSDPIEEEDDWMR